MGSGWSFAQENDLLQELFESIDKINDDSSPENSVWSGKHPEKFVFQTESQLRNQAKQLEQKIQELNKFPIDQLSRQDQISLAIKKMQVQNTLSGVRYQAYLIPFNSEGGFYNETSYFLSNLPFEDYEDYTAYLNWLPSYTEYLAYNQELMRKGIEQSIMASAILVENNISLMGQWITADFSRHPLMAPFNHFPTTLSKTQTKELIRKAQAVFRANILPAYQGVHEFMRVVYLPACPEKVGVSEIKDGKEYYEDRIKFFTTLDISPDSVFALGQQEVARIRALMKATIAQTSFDGGFAEFVDFLRTDPQFYPQTGQELLNKAAWLSKKAEGQLPRLFSKLYRLPFTIEPVPEVIAPNYTGGRYVPGSRTRNKAGIYWVNTYNLPSRTLYTLPALTLHEAVPGHHLQITLASELTDLPAFRQSYYISAFGEGWGLYAEYLGEEMGMYETPYDWFGRYTYEMWRACRLVVDVGLHYKGWTREQAQQFMEENTALSLHEVKTEIDRYIGWPGQAVSYKIGELTIKQMRKEAEEKLGEAFNIREFHETVLKNGSVPLPILQEEVRGYIHDELVTQGEK